MTKRDLYKIAEGINNVRKLKGVKFAYVISKNMRIIENEIESIQKSIAPSIDYVEFEKKGVALCEKHCLRGHDKQPILNKNKEYTFDDFNVFKSYVTELEKEHSKVINDRKKQEKEFELLLDEKSEIILHTVALEFVPEDITTEQFNGIYELIIDNHA